MSFDALRWALDLILPVVPKAVLIVLADHADEHHVCWPGQGRIAERAGLRPRAVQLALKQIEAMGLIVRNRVEGMVTTYTLTVGLHPVPVVSAPSPSHDVQGLGVGTLARNAPVNGLTPASHAPPPSHDMQGNLKKEVSKKERELRSLVRLVHPKPELELNPAEGFDDFYRDYPKHEKRKPALEAWVRLVRSGVRPATILHGLSRYQHSPTYRYIPLPASWLNARCWEDQQPPNAHADADDRPAKRSVNERILDIVYEGRAWGT